MKNKIINILKKYTKQNNIFLTERGNKAILTALKIVKEKFPNGKILIPDQGGWLTYFQYAEKLKFNIEKLKTDYGVIDVNSLREKDASAIIYSNPAGYYAEQNVKEIYEICKKNNILVILDISGCIGSDFYNGNYADMIVCSFGKWKPINLGHGGFISVNSSTLEDKKYLENLTFEEGYYSSLYNKLINLKTRYEFFEQINKKIKKGLEQFNIIHKNNKGINVIVKFNNEEEKNKIKTYCEKNKYEFVECPKMIKVNAEAISIEVKRIE